MPLVRLALILCIALAATARAEAPRIVTDIPPVQSLVAMVTGAAPPDVLLDGLADPHHFQLRPSQARALASADAVIWIGPEFTPWLSGAADTAKVSLPLMELPGTTLRSLDGDDHDHGADDDHHDPHAWLDPRNAQTWLPVIAETLAALDPPKAQAYHANAAAAAIQLETLAVDLAARLEAAAPLVVLHDAYGYFTDRFGLTIAAAVLPPHGEAATPASVRAARRAARGAACLFAEPGADPDLLTAVAPDLPVVPLDPLGANLPAGPKLYPAILNALTDAIATCASP